MGQRMDEMGWREEEEEGQVGKEAKVEVSRWLVVVVSCCES